MCLNSEGIRSKTRKETKHREEDHVEWQRRWRGLCNQTEYWTGVPTKKWVAYQEEKIVFDLDPESIKVASSKIIVCLFSPNENFIFLYFRACPSTVQKLNCLSLPCFLFQIVQKVLLRSILLLVLKYLLRPSMTNWFTILYQMDRIYSNINH